MVWRSPFDQNNHEKAFTIIIATKGLHATGLGNHNLASNKKRTRGKTPLNDTGWQYIAEFCPRIKMTLSQKYLDLMHGGASVVKYNK